MLALLLLAAAAIGAAPAQAFEPGTLAIQSRDGTVHNFTIELASTPDERAQGLMYRTELPPDAGMLFDFEEEQPVSMWMKNTILPLDMLFIAGSGEITGIAADTVPHSETTISSPGPVRAVLELNAGTASRLGITAGDRVSHPLFDQRGQVGKDGRKPSLTLAMVAIAARLPPICQKARDRSARLDPQVAQQLVEGLAEAAWSYQRMK